MKKFEYTSKFGMWFVICMSVVSVVLTYRTLSVRWRQQSDAQQIFSSDTQYSKVSLATYDGTDPSKPILLAFEGNVYDVSAGREFYAPGGVYHMLAGTDATALLHIAGGSIIRKKYPIVGRFVL